jgi:hypothetical protein
MLSTDGDGINLFCSRSLSVPAEAAGTITPTSSNKHQQGKKQDTGGTCTCHV